MVKVCKFGGSSLASGQNVDRVERIIRSCNKRKIIVVSAFGIGGDYRQKVTDTLIKCCGLRDRGEDYIPLLDGVLNRYADTAKYFGLYKDFVKDLAYVKKHSAVKSRDWIISRGEYLSAKLLSLRLGFAFIDAEDVVYLKDGQADYENSRNALLSIDFSKGIVVPGYYGKGKTSVELLSRGGSDETGALLARVYGAEYENWTDVNGIQAVSPSVIKDAQTVERLSYMQAYKVAKSGSTVFSDGACLMLADSGIITEIKNTFDDTGKFTRLSDDAEDVESVKVITYKDGADWSVINFIGNKVDSPNMRKRIIDAIKKQKIPFKEQIATADGQMLSVKIYGDAKSVVKNAYSLLFT